MGENQDRSWWSTLPGMMTATAGFVTAISGLILALNTAGFFRREPSPVAPVTAKTPDAASKPAEQPPVAPVSAPEKPVSAAEQLEYDSYYNAKYGYSVVYPKALLFAENETSVGRRFKSTDGKVMLSVLSVDNTEHQMPAAAYSDMIQQLSRNSPVTITYQMLEPRGFEIGTKNGPKVGHLKMVMNDAYFRLLNMEYDVSVGATFDGVWTHIAEAFAR